MKTPLATCFLSGAALVLAAFLPPILSAAAPLRIFQPSGGLTLTSVAGKFGGMVNAVIPVLLGVAAVAVIWGVFKYITAAGDTEKLAEGRKAAIYGVLALFIMLAFWGFVVIIKNALFG